MSIDASPLKRWLFGEEGAGSLGRGYAYSAEYKRLYVNYKEKPLLQVFHSSRLGVLQVFAFDVAPGLSQIFNALGVDLDVRVEDGCLYTDSNVLRVWACSAPSVLRVDVKWQ